MENLQEIINTTADNAKYDIETGEYITNLVIDKPITLRGRGWVLHPTLIGKYGSDAVITVFSEGVVLENLQLSHEDEDHGIALQYAPGKRPTLNKVEIIKGQEKQLTEQEVQEIVTRWKKRDKVLTSLTELSEHDAKTLFNTLKNLQTDAKSQFETEEEYLDRTRKERQSFADDAGIFQIGYIDLVEYDLDSQNYKLAIRYLKWVENVMGETLVPRLNNPYIIIDRYQARGLYEDKKVHTLYSSLVYGSNQVFIQPYLFFLKANRLPQYLQAKQRFLRAHQSPVYALCYHNGLLISGDEEGYIQFWEQANNQVGKFLKVPGKVEDLTFIPNTDYAAAACANKIIYIFDINTAKVINKLQGHKNSIRDITPSTNGKYLFSAATDGVVNQWESKDGKLFETYGSHKEIINAIVLTNNGKYAISGGKDEAIKLWEVPSGKVLRVYKGHTKTIKSLAITPDNTTLASGSADASIKLWDVKKGQVIKTLEGHKSTVSALAFSPDGHFLVSASWDKTIKLWNTYTGQLLETFSAHKEAIEKIVFDEQGKFIYSVGRDKTIICWQVS